MKHVILYPLLPETGEGLRVEFWDGVWKEQKSYFSDCHEPLMKDVIEFLGHTPRTEEIDCDAYSGNKKRRILEFLKG